MSDQMEEIQDFSHLDQRGDARMVNVGDKTIQKRRAKASGLIRMAAPTLEAIKGDRLKKGNVLAVARIAGIQAAKATSNLIPLCHLLPLDGVQIDFEIQEKAVLASCSVSCQARTGVEMEALTGVSIALLTVYDMCKAIDKEMIIDQVRLISKQKEDLAP